LNNASYYAWGFQLEVAAFASNYIPATAGASVTRAVETARFGPLIEAILQRVQGGVLVRVDLSNEGSATRRVVGCDGTTNFIRASSTKTDITLNLSSALSSTIGSGTNDGPFGAAAAFDVAGRSIVSNGGTVATDSTAVSARTTVYLGRDNTNTAGQYGTGYYDYVGIFAERPDNTNLQALAVAA
jgi:hypothetical protein